ncbi:MAG: hypothetical protein V4591_05315 [Bdellovibrionota bacterium]
MNIPAIIFTKKPLTPTTNQVLFCLAESTFPDFDLAKTSPTEFAAQNHLLRHDKFDWYVNKLKPICFLFENENLPSTAIISQNIHTPVHWLTFPQAIKKITNGAHRNLVQLAVQYISYGMIDDSVIAADYDAEWLKNLQSK